MEGKNRNVRDTCEKYIYIWIWMNLAVISGDVSQEEILLRSDWSIDMSEGEFTGLKKYHQHRG